MRLKLEMFLCAFILTQIEAFYAYKEAKETYIKEVANKWKDNIDSRVYDALMNYQVEINDQLSIAI